MCCLSDWHQSIKRQHTGHCHLHRKLCKVDSKSALTCRAHLSCTTVQVTQPEGGAKGRRGIFEILKGGLLRRKRDMGDHGDRDLLQGNARYRKLQDLNEGTFGVVMLALDTQAREQVAIKFLERGAGERSLTLCLYCAHPVAENSQLCISSKRMRCPFCLQAPA